jgi:uncharacterized protein with GYD domain
VAIGEVPDNAALAAICMRLTASGVVDGKAIILITPEEIDRAAKL